MTPLILQNEGAMHPRFDRALKPNCFEHGVGATQSWVGAPENRVSYTQTRASYTFDRIKTLMGILESEMCRVAVAGENQDCIDAFGLPLP